MINLRKGNTETIYFTGTEKATLTAPYFLFTFTNRVTTEEVKIFCVNTSTTARYDKFSIVVNTWFGNSTEGTWEYSIQEYTNDEGRPQDYLLETSHFGVVVETGRMYLRPATAFAPTEYTEQPNAFKTYDGQ